MKQLFFSLFIAIFLSSFLVACRGDGKNDEIEDSNVPLTINSTFPAIEAKDVEPGTQVTATFNRSIDSSTLDTQSFNLTDSMGHPIAGELSYKGLTAAFTPSDDLSLAVTYTATITGVEDELGLALSSPYSWSFTTRDRTWTSREFIDWPASDPHVAIDPEGNGIAVWLGSEDLISSCIMAGYYKRDSGWITPVCLQTANYQFLESPRIAMDELGNGVTVWVGTDPNGSHRYLNSNRFLLDQGWGMPVLLETNENEEVSYPQIAINKLGLATVVWQQSNGAHQSVWANQGTAEGWGTPVQMDDGQSNALWPQVVMYGNGGAMVIWEQRDDMLLTTTAVWANIFVPGEGWSGAEKLPPDGLGLQSPQIAVDNIGNALIVGTDWASTPACVRAVWYSPGQGFSTPSKIETISEDTGFPDVAMDGYGNALIVWLQWDENPPYHVWAKRYSQENGWSPAAIVDGALGTAGRPQAAIDSNGNGIVMWEQSTGSQYALMTSRCLFNSEFSAPIPIDEGGTNNYYVRAFADIAVNATGQALAVWETFPAFGNEAGSVYGSSFK